MSHPLFLFIGTTSNPSPCEKNHYFPRGIVAESVKILYLCVEMSISGCINFQNYDKS